MHASSILGRSALVLAALAISACENGSRTSSKLPDPLPSPGFQPPATRPEHARVDLSKEAEDLQAAFDQINSKSPPSTGGDGGEPGTSALNKPQGRAGDRSASRNRPTSKPAPALAANQSATLPDTPTEPPARPRKTADERSPAQKRQDAVAELASQLKPGIDGGKEPLRVAMPLIGLDIISPSSGQTNLEMVSRAVTPDQRRTLDTVRDLVRSFGTDPNLAAADPDAVAKALRDKAELLSASSSPDRLGLGTVALCQRVDGYGRFVSLGTSTFLAGRANAMIVYSEIENFSQSQGVDAAGGNASQWRVELGQTVRLYLESDGSEQLVLPESVVRDQSLSKRRDFFLVQRVDLPKNMSVGNYRLKVTVRDIASGALAERAVPIRVVADASALSDRDWPTPSASRGTSSTSGRYADAATSK